MDKLAFIKNKKIVIGLVGAVFIVLIFIFAFSSKTVDSPCDWCKSRPSVEYSLKNGGVSYVCKDCSKKCAWCDKKATKHYENLAEMMTFVCDDCYKDISE